MPIDKDFIETLSDNPVQQDIINQLFGDQDPEYPLDLQDGEDQFDFANYVAALRKAADWIYENKLRPVIEDNKKNYPEFFPFTAEKTMEYAMKDWDQYPHYPNNPVN